jgi:hypothetical protein
MKILVCFLMTTLTLLSMNRNGNNDDEDGPSHSKHTHPELYCMRLLEKMEWLMDEISTEMNKLTETKDPKKRKEQEDHIEWLEHKLKHCHSKINSKSSET